MKPTRRQLVQLLASGTAGVVLAAEGEQFPGAQVTVRPTPVSDRLRNLMLDDAVEPALKFRPPDRS